MVDSGKLEKLREVITENLRVQRDGEAIEYINVGTALGDAKAKQNHVIFARRGCGKTLLLHYSSKLLKSELKTVYLNCEDFKRHTFPNVLIEILKSLFREIERNLQGWFGKKRRSRQIIQQLIFKLENLQKSADSEMADVTQKSGIEKTRSGDGAFSSSMYGIDAKGVAKASSTRRDETERSFKTHREKLLELDHWLPELKESIREFFQISNSVTGIFLQIDDLYHLRRTDQAFVIDYIHRLCKDLPLHFKVATLRHASTLYVDRDGQPIGAQERHDYQPINIDYTFSDFKKTREQNWQILETFGARAGMNKDELASLFKGEGFARLVMAGGGVPRDVLSLFLEVLSAAHTEGDGRIGKDEVRILSRANLERRIEELKQDSHGDEQDGLIQGIYVLREFCLERKSNLFVIRERMLQQDDKWRNLFYRLMDYRIIHNCGTALTHKSQEGTYQAFAIDIGCYAHLRKLQNRFTEIDVSASDAKERMRSAPVLEAEKLIALSSTVPSNVEEALLEDLSE